MPKASAEQILYLKTYIEAARERIDGLRWFLDQSEPPSGADRDMLGGAADAIYEITSGIVQLAGADPDKYTGLQLLQNTLGYMRKFAQTHQLPPEVAVPEYDDGALIIRLAGQSRRPLRMSPAVYHGDVDDSFAFADALFQVAEVIERQVEMDASR